MTEIHQLEEKLNQMLQDQIMPISRALHVGWPNLPSQLSHQAQVLLIGNHSSGKSSFINYLLGEELQKTGMAPTDDGFTLIIQGSAHDTIDGHAAVSNPAFTAGHLRNLGPSFLSRLKVKTSKSPFLSDIRLVDSPGMIDHQGADRGRGYDFKNAVRSFAESSDLILLFFDPDKPGTTGETMEIYTDTLSGLEHKMVILLHKVDQMTSLADFARSYGTLCWNLSRQSTTKDMPQIFTTYIPDKVTQYRRQDPDALNLEEFKNSLDEVQNEISRAPVRRVDNLLTELDRRSRWLRMVLNVIRKAQSRRFKFIAITWASTLLFLALGGTWAYAERATLPNAAGISLGALLLATTAYVAGTYYLNLDKVRFQSDAELDILFKDAYQTEYQIGHRADIENLWVTIKPTLKTILKNPGLSALPNTGWIKKRILKLSSILQKDIPELRELTQDMRQKDVLKNENQTD